MSTDLEKLVGLLEKNPNLVTKILELATPAEEVPEGNEFECVNCGHTLYLKKPKKVCPQCKKHKLQLVLTDVQPLTAKQKNANAIEASTMKIKGANNPLDKRLARKEQIGRFNNEFVDDSKLCSEDTKIDKLLWKNASVSPRPTAPRTVTTARCVMCSKTEEVPKIVTTGGKDYICNQCIIASRGRQGHGG